MTKMGNELVKKLQSLDSVSVGVDRHHFNRNETVVSVLAGCPKSSSVADRSGRDPDLGTQRIRSPHRFPRYNPSA